MQNGRKLLKSIIAAVLVCLLLVCFCFVIAEAEHDCPGEDCHICRQMVLCTDMLRHMKHTVFALALCLFADFSLRFHTAFLPEARRSVFTPVSFKVKLSV